MRKRSGDHGMCCGYSILGVRLRVSSSSQAGGFGGVGFRDRGRVYTILCHAMLCYANLYFTILYYAILYHAILDTILYYTLSLSLYIYIYMQ